MAGAFTTVNLSQLPAPDVVETLAYEAILSDMLLDLRARDSTFDAMVESDPAYKILEVAAYREVLLRQRVNDAAKGVMLAFAEKSDLDQLGANYDVERLLIEPGDPSTIPPTPAIYESDDAFRARIPLSLEGYTTAGSEGSYVYHALSADGGVKDAAAFSPVPGSVTVYVLGYDGDGTASDDLISAVTAALNAEKVRPMTDKVSVLSASIVGYTIEASLTVYPGPAADTVLAAAEAAVAEYATEMHRIGYDITLSGIYKALHQSGVQNVTLTAPTSNITISEGQAPYCTGVTLTVGGTGV